jgi:hypothetical protein
VGWRRLWGGDPRRHQPAAPDAGGTHHPDGLDLPAAGGATRITPLLARLVDALSPPRRNCVSHPATPHRIPPPDPPPQGPSHRRGYRGLTTPRGHQADVTASVSTPAAAPGAMPWSRRGHAAAGARLGDRGPYARCAERRTGGRVPEPRLRIASRAPARAPPRLGAPLVRPASGGRSGTRAARADRPGSHHHPCGTCCRTGGPPQRVCGSGVTS